MSDIFLSDSRPDLAVYCDGGCSPNPGTGGWGVCAFAAGDHARLLGGYSGGDPATTNNRMELEALRHALQYVAAYSREELGGFIVHIYSDSTYALGRLNARYSQWRVNDDLRPGLVAAWTAARRTDADIHVHWVRGHQGERGNEMADRLATQGREGK